MTATTVAPPRLRTIATVPPTVALCWLVLAVAVAWALFPGLFTSYDPYQGDPAASFAPPSWEHLFGADRLGRDLFSRTVHGAGTTLTATLVAVLLAFGVGSTVGLVAGYAGGRVEAACMRLIDVLLSIPRLLLAMVIVAVLGYSTVHVALAVGVATIAPFARVMRAETVRVVRSEYVEAAHGLGVGRGTVLVGHVLPNALGPVLALAAVELGTTVLEVASLGFLGYGAPPPEPEWGLLVAEGRDFIAIHPWISVLPGVVLALVVVATHRISVSLRSRSRAPEA